MLRAWSASKRSFSQLRRAITRCTEDVEREWAGRLAAEEAKRKEANEWATELAHVLEKEKKVCPLAVSKNVD